MSNPADLFVHVTEDDILLLDSKWKQGDLEGVLAHACQMASKYASVRSHAGVLYIPQLDSIIKSVGDEIRKRQFMRRGTVSQGVVLHVASLLYTIGGHTRVIEDMARVLPEYRHILVVTDLYSLYENARRTGKPVEEPILGRFDQFPMEVMFVRGSSFTEKAANLMEMIAAIAPRAISLMVHPEDGIAYSAVCGESAPKVIFVHHTDHSPGLGATRADYMHIDTSPECHKTCIRSISHARSDYFGVATRDYGVVQPRNDLGSGRGLTVVTCGSWPKYIDRPGVFTYRELLVALFKGGVQQVTHISNIPEVEQTRLRQFLSASGIEPERLQFVLCVPVLAEALLELSPDFYLDAHPVYSGRAVTEAMSVGLPVMMTAPPDGTTAVHVDMSGGHAVKIESLKDVAVGVQTIRARHREMSVTMRTQYELRYSETHYRNKLLDIIWGDS